MSEAVSAGRKGAPVAPRLLVFLALLACGLAALEFGGRGLPQDLAALGVMWVPGLAALLTALVMRNSFHRLGWRLGKPRYLAAAYLTPFAYAAIPFAIALAVGAGTLTMQWWPTAAGHLGLPATPLFGFLVLATLNVLFAMISALGEELGWRGFLVPLLAERLSFRLITMLTWMIWLGFHLPGLLSGTYGAPGIPVWWAILAFAVMLLPLTIFMNWLRLTSGSVWPCVLAHGAHNAFVGEMFASAIVPNETTPWIVGEFSLVMPPVVALAVLLAIRLFGAGESGRCSDESPPATLAVLG